MKFPFVDKLGQGLADKGLVVWAINVGESKKTVAGTQRGAGGELCRRRLIPRAGRDSPDSPDDSDSD
jgi:hypothetical protein